MLTEFLMFTQSSSPPKVIRLCGQVDGRNILCYVCLPLFLRRNTVVYLKCDGGKVDSIEAIEPVTLNFGQWSVN